MSTIYTNARIFTGAEIISNGNLLVEEGKIVSVGSTNHLPQNAARVIDCTGLSLAPACIDLQVYGGNGKLFNNEPTVETIQQTWESVRKGGAAHFQITLSCSPLETMWQAIDACRAYKAQGGQGLLGLHLEGPFFNPEKRGAHPLQHIRKANLDDIQRIINHSAGVATYMTLAPEQVDDVCLRHLLNSNILIAAGHSNASFEQALHGFDVGIDRVTHLFNAMSPFQGRAPGLVGATYIRKPWTSIIADGIHLDYQSLRISKQLLGEKLFLISDAVTESQNGDYHFHFSGDRYVDDSGVLAGSALTMWQAVCNVVQHAGIALDEALRMASTYPAEVIGAAHRLGRIATGFEAHIIAFDESMTLFNLEV